MKTAPIECSPRHSPLQFFWLILLLAILSSLMLYPLFLQIGHAFFDNGRLSPIWVFSALHNDTFRRQILTSLGLALAVTLLCNLIAFPLALIGRHFDFAGKTFIAGLVLVPMILPPFVGAIGLRQILGNFGSLTVLLQQLGLANPHEGIRWLSGDGIGSFCALAILMALGLYPIAYLNLQASLANIDPAMLEAAANLGGRRFSNFFRITLPLAMPGVFAGSTLIFIWAFTELGTPLLLQYRNVVSRAIWDDLAATSGGNSSIGFAKVVIVLAISVGAYILGKRVFGRSAGGEIAMTSKAATSSAAKRLSFPRSILAALPFLVVIFFAVLPHIGVILYSFTAIASEPAAGWGVANRFGWYRTIIPDRYTLAGYQAVFQTPEIYAAIFNSIKYAGVATLLDIVLGISIAWLLVRTRIRGRGLLDALAMLPLAVPGLVMAFGFIALLLQFNLRTLLQTGPFWILVIAYTVRRLPYLVRSAAGGLEQTSVTLEEAAANMGASPMRVLWKITLPLILANLIAGSLLTFAFAMLEVSDSLLLAQVQKFYPITKMIYVLGSDMSGPANVRNACALGVIAMVMLTVLLLGAAMLMGKRLGAVFRA